jgi:hypothetical protein
MTQALRSSLATVLAVALSALAACLDSDAPNRSVYVQAAWQSARLTTGHQTHVVDHKMGCAQCHELSGEQVGAATPGRCAACHQEQSRLRHAEAEAAKRFGVGTQADCSSCHEFSASKLREPEPAALDGGISHADFKPGDCARCHGVAQGATPAVVVHGGTDCVSCHHVHQDLAPRPGSCAGCHADIETTHAALGKSPQQVCTTCHQHQHAPASDALATCQSCHETTSPTVPKSALFAGGHSECVTCPAPHDFAKQATLPCRSCHAEVHVLAAATVPAHAQCVSCHAPHDVRASPEKACVNCHANVHPEHPQLDAAGSCIGCHDPHPATDHAPATARPCSGCHQAAHSDQGFHERVTCTQCHKPHAFALANADRGLCNGCHAQQLSAVAKVSGHQDCSGCHAGLPHHPGTLASCSTCHAKEQHQALAGHAQCASCHEPHSGAQLASCASCHAQEARTAPAGHTQCVKCHQPHTGSTVGVECSTCHAAEAHSQHGQLAKGGCLSCHRPHGPTGQALTPACTSCHQVAQLVGLHQAPKHQDCSICHAGHGDRPSLARDACLSCHTDRKTHFPDAPRCASCHLFESGKGSHGALKAP